MSPKRKTNKVIKKKSVLGGKKLIKKNIVKKKPVAKRKVSVKKNIVKKKPIAKRKVSVKKNIVKKKPVAKRKLSLKVKVAKNKSVAKQKKAIKKKTTKTKIVKPRKLTKEELKKQEQKRIEKEIKVLYSELPREVTRPLRQLIKSNKSFISFDEVQKKTKVDISAQEKKTIKNIIDLSGLDFLTDSSFIENKEEVKQESYFAGINPKTYDSVQLYLKAIGKYTLLTSKEEKELGNAIQLRNRILSGEMKPKTVFEKRKLLSKGLEARNRLACSNLRLVVSVARIYNNRANGLTLLDLAQQGTDGLYKAADKFDPGKGFKFSTYATHWIRQSITREISNSTRTIRLPVHMVETLNKYKEIIVTLEQALGREPKIQEIADEMGISIAKVNKIRSSEKEMLKLDKPLKESGGNDTLMMDIIDDAHIEKPEDSVSKEILKVQLNEILGTLTQRERDIIEYRHGMKDGGVKYTLEQIGKKFNVTRERIRQKEAEALSKLKENKDINRLKSY